MNGTTDFKLFKESMDARQFSAGTEIVIATDIMGDQSKVKLGVCTRAPDAPAEDALNFWVTPGQSPSQIVNWARLPIAGEKIKFEV